jgi:thiamine biosynthesis lipoprotein
MISAGPPLRRVEFHMNTAVTLGATGLSDDDADRFFARVAELEGLLSRFRPGSEVSRVAAGELALDDADPAVRRVVLGCEELRELTDGAFDHEPRRRSGSPADPVLDVNAFAKGWIVEEAAASVRMVTSDFFVNAGGDVLAGIRADGSPWRVGVQHPVDREAILGAFDLRDGAVATSGTYERGRHIRGETATEPLVSVTVAGPDLAWADGLATAVFASGDAHPSWWEHVDPAYGLLTVSSDDRVRWRAPRVGVGIDWRFPTGSRIHGGGTAS